jgi:hypothetical protein
VSGEAIYGAAGSSGDATGGTEFVLDGGKGVALEEEAGGWTITAPGVAGAEVVGVAGEAPGTGVASSDGEAPGRAGTGLGEGSGVGVGVGQAGTISSQTKSSGAEPPISSRYFLHISVHFTKSGGPDFSAVPGKIR